ncbi:Response regulator receiver domain-containing protein [Mariprofundus ferrinatatus]|uniref:Response regulator receiver domain-containing protein n=1 Tax=Mariprofundus ferrinatatus TaxID=1921087 RepID=A0A2K8L1S2_9PROT|nr:response regulator [Mariprofundus ferrinatatus]ATX81032.1 Response regulator receiver domain-containing protein [Mariprofundus ferrinatatus]
MFHIVDDDNYIREFLSELLILLGHGVESFACPLQYLSYMESPGFTRPICVFTDIRMPEMSGYEMIEEIHRRYPEQRIVTISGYSQEKPPGLRTCQFIGKPFNPADIEQLVTTLAKCHAMDGAPDAGGDVRGGAPDESWKCPINCFECDRNKRPA